MSSSVLSKNILESFNPESNIYILGTGAIGCYIGAALKSHQNNVTFLVRSQSRLNEFMAQQNSVVYGRVNEKEASTVSGFKASIVDDTKDNAPITSLIVCTKIIDTVKAVKLVAPRITSETNIVLFQNGYGIVEELIESLWSNTTPPTIFVAVNRNSIASLSSYQICHHYGYSDPDAIRIGQYPIRHQPQQANKAFLIQKILEVPELQAAFLPWPELLSSLYKKLLINACTNPLSAIMPCNIGKIIMEDNKSGISLVRSILYEAYQVLGDSIHGETYESLLEMIFGILTEAKDHQCSTLQDIKNKKLTEIDYINGYVCKLGREKNIDTKINEALVNLIHFKEHLYE